MMKKILHNFSYVFLANIANAFSKFVYLIIITKFLTTKDLGAYTLAIAVTAPIALLFNMKMRSYIVSTDYVDYEKYRRFRDITNIASVILTVIISVLFYSHIIMTMILVALSKILEINSEFYQSWPNKEKKFQTSAKLMIMRVSIMMVSFIVVALLTHNLIITLSTNLLIQFLILIIERKVNLSLIDLNKYVNRSVSYKFLLLTLLPLGIVQALMSFSTSIPKFLLDYFSSLEIVGIYSAVAYLMTVVSLFMNSINQTLLPYIKKVYKENMSLFTKFVNVYCNLIFLILGLLFLGFTLLWGDQILTLLYTKEFAKYDFILSVCAASVFLNMASWTYDSGLLLANAIRWQPIFLGMSMILTLGVGIVLVSKYDVVGANVTLIMFQLLNTLSKAIYFNITILRKKRRNREV